MKSAIIALLTLPLCAQTPVPAPAPVALSDFSLTAALGMPTTPVRHVSAWLGFTQRLSDTEEFAFNIGIEPNAATFREQESLLLGFVQKLGTAKFFGLDWTTWGSAMFGTLLSNATKISYSGGPQQIVASASTNPLFQAEYAFGMTHQFSARLAAGPVVKYDHVVGLPGQTQAGIFVKWSPR